MMNRSALLPLALLLAGCAATPTPSPVSPVVVSPPIAAPVAPKEAEALASPLLAAVPADATLVARFNGKALRAAPLFQATVGALRGFGMVQQRLDEWNDRCGVPILYAVDEVVAVATSPSPEDLVVIAAVRGGTPKTAQCLGAMAGAKADLPPVPFEGGQILRVSPARVVVFADNLFFVGPEASVERALKAVRRQDGAVAGVVRPLLVGPDAVLAFSLDGPGYGPVSSARGVLDIDANHLAISAVAGLASAEEASSLAQTMRDGIDDAVTTFYKAPDGAGSAFMAHLTLIRVTTDGARLHVNADLAGGAEAQSRLVSTLAGVGTYAVEQYLAQSKLAEAKNTVNYIALSLAAHMELEDENGKQPPRFPPSAPPTPAQVPRGALFVPNATTWSHPTWRAIRFEVSTPIHYSYEIITSKDGRTATVRAHGDLDGDGKLSTIERTLTLRKDGAIVKSPKLVLQDELE